MFADDRGLHRSFLYVPGSDPAVMHKALASVADAVILDLEDAVAPAGKDLARASVAAVVRTLADESASDRPAVHVRINRDGDGHSRPDLEAVVAQGLTGIRLPKVESGEQVADVALLLDDLELAQGMQRGAVALYPTIESALGVVQLDEIVTASDRIRRVALGATDLLADIGAAGDEDLATLAIRTQMVLMSRAHGVGPPVDSVHTRLDDDAGLRAAARRARSLGFWGKSVIHPRQLAAVHDVFTPDQQQLEWAHAVLVALDDAAAADAGVALVDGQFVDEAVAARARLILRRKGSTR